MNVIFISDLHIPYQHPDAFEFLEELKAHIDEPAKVVCLGDMVDIHHTQWHNANPDCMGPEDEYQAACDIMRRNLFKTFPKMEICNSNHGIRYDRIMKLANIPGGVRKKLTQRRIWDAPPGWKWADQVKIKLGDGSIVVAEHGDKCRQFDARAKQGFSYHTVTGHYHTKGGVIWYTSGEGKTRFSVSAGCLIDPNQPAFGYTHHKPVLGTAAIINDEPHFFRMVLDKHGRWNGGPFYD